MADPNNFHLPKAITIENVGLSIILCGVRSRVAQNAHRSFRLGHVRPLKTCFSLWSVMVPNLITLVKGCGSMWRIHPLNWGCWNPTPRVGCIMNSMKNLSPKLSPCKIWPVYVGVQKVGLPTCFLPRQVTMLNLNALSQKVWLLLGSLKRTMLWGSHTLKKVTLTRI